MVKTIQRFNVRRMYSLLHIQFINIQKASTVHKYVTFDWKDRMSFYSVVGNWRLCLFVFQGKPVNRYVQFLVLSLSLFSPIEWQLIFKRLTTNSTYMFNVRTIFSWYFCLVFPFHPNRIPIDVNEYHGPTFIIRNSRCARPALLFFIEQKQYNLSMMIITSNLIMLALISTKMILICFVNLLVFHSI